MIPLLDLRFVMLSGKGGVGRTTVAAALARIAADAGKRVLLAEATTADRLGRMFGRAEPLGSRVETVAPGIDAVNITSEVAIREYGTLVLRSELVSRALFENRAVRGFFGAIPGLDAYAILGKVWWHTTELVADREPSPGRPRYDLVIFDGPASGHAAQMLRIPQAILTAMPKGPLSPDARAISELLHDPARAALVIVTLAEELPAREASELAAALRADVGVPLGPLVVNAVPTGELEAPSVTDVLARASRATDGLGATLRLAASVRAHRQAADAVLRKLARDPGLPLVTLPRIPTAEVSPAICAKLAESLAAGLAGLPSASSK
jgi:anion-transporting  ArsA/GET3 family ATPase